jgi:hypothetical protein
MFLHYADPCRSTLLSCSPEAFTATPSIYHFQMINNTVPGFWLATLFIIG